MLKMDMIFLGLALMSRLDTMYPSSFPFGTLKTHFSGFNLMLNLQRFVNVVAKFAIRSRLDTMYPSSFPFGTPKTHFSGFNLMLNLRRFVNAMAKFMIRSQA